MLNILSLNTKQIYDNRNIKSISFSQRNENYDVTEVTENDEYIQEKEKLDNDKDTRVVSSQKTPQINNITIVKNKSLSETALDFAKFAITEPISLYAILLAGSYVIRPLAPVAVLGSSLYGISKIFNGIFPSKNENNRKQKNIGKGTLACGLSFIFSKGALKIAGKGGLKEAGKTKEISKLSLLQSYKKCVELNPEALSLSLSKLKKAVLALGITKWVKRVSPTIIKLLKKII